MSLHSKKIAALILAAGESKRMGKPKQNLVFENQTMLNHIKKHLTLNFVEQTFIVLGAYANEVVEKCGLETHEYFVFEDWKEGMGSSLSFACSKIFAENDYDGLLVTLSDLPMVSKDDYRKMIHLFADDKDIVATKAGETIGVPAIFGRAYFNDLLAIKGEKGAKSLIQKNRKKVKLYSNPNAGTDIDTEKDYSRL